MQQAYAPYRVALFRTNAGDAQAAAQAIFQASQSWATLRQQFSVAPAPYDRDAGFGPARMEVAGVYDKAAAEVQAGRLSDAHETLEAVRDVLARLRERNQVVVYSDHMNAYHEAMENALTIDTATLDRPEARMAAMAHAGVLAYLADQLQVKAPASLRSQAAFTELLAAVRKSVAQWKAALLQQDAAAARAAQTQLKGPYSKLFLTFG